MWSRISENWFNHSLPVIIVLSSPTTGELIWECVNKQTAKRCQEGWKIIIPRKQTIPTSKEMLYDLANKQSEFTSRWTSLVLAKEWMLHSNEKGSLILEVEEWINTGCWVLKPCTYILGGDGTFNVYEDIRDKLMAKGVPANEIAFIHDADTETRKAELFGKVRSGQVRFLLGSTAKMGAGTNVLKDRAFRNSVTAR